MEVFLYILVGIPKIIEFNDNILLLELLGADL